MSIADRFSSPVSGSSTASRRCSRSDACVAPEKIAVAIDERDREDQPSGRSRRACGSSAKRREQQQSDQERDAEQHTAQLEARAERDRRQREPHHRRRLLGAGERDAHRDHHAADAPADRGPAMRVPARAHEPVGDGRGDQRRGQRDQEPEADPRAGRDQRQRQHDERAPAVHAEPGLHVDQTLVAQLRSQLSRPLRHWPDIGRLTGRLSLGSGHRDRAAAARVAAAGQAPVRGSRSTACAPPKNRLRSEKRTSARPVSLEPAVSTPGST